MLHDPCVNTIDHAPYAQLARVGRSEALAGCPNDGLVSMVTRPVKSVADPSDLQHVIAGPLVEELVVAYTICVVQTEFAACDQGL